MDKQLFRRHYPEANPRDRQAVWHHPEGYIARGALASPWLRAGVYRSVTDDNLLLLFMVSVVLYELK